jgi:mono/diheme cytochrome c family protein
VSNSIRLIPLASLIALLFLGVSCQFYHEKDSGDDAALVSVKTVSYRMVMQNVVSSRCLRCHANEFNSYDAVRKRISEIQDRALVRRDMPPSGPLSKSESKILKTWIDAGMPLNQGEASEPLPALSPTFQSIRANIFETRCLRCHGPGESHDDINIFDQSTVTGAKGWVVPFDPEKSELYQDITKTTKGRMPPIAKPGKPTVDPLTPEQIDTIRTWILNGAND